MLFLKNTDMVNGAVNTQPQKKRVRRKITRKMVKVTEPDILSGRASALKKKDIKGVDIEAPMITQEMMTFLTKFVKFKLRQDKKFVVMFKDCDITSQFMKHQEPRSRIEIIEMGVNVSEDGKASLTSLKTKIMDENSSMKIRHWICRDPESSHLPESLKTLISEQGIKKRILYFARKRGTGDFILWLQN